MGGAWKVAYADFVTAMMAFFLLMWILNMVPPETKAGLAAYFHGERNFDSSATSPVSNNPFIQNTDKIDARDLKISEVEKSHYAIAQKMKQMLMADAVPQSASGIHVNDYVSLLVAVQSLLDHHRFPEPVTGPSGTRHQRTGFRIIRQIRRRVGNDLIEHPQTPGLTAYPLQGIRHRLVGI